MTSNQPWWLTMPPAELAATILPLFSSSFRNENIVIKGIVNWCKTGQYREPLLKGLSGEDRLVISEAIQVLEHAGLLIRFLRVNITSFARGAAAGGVHDVWFDIGLTRRGMYALQTNTVRQHLGLSAPPA